MQKYIQQNKKTKKEIHERYKNYKTTVSRETLDASSPLQTTTTERHFQPPTRQRTRTWP